MLRLGSAILNGSGVKDSMIPSFAVAFDCPPPQCQTCLPSLRYLSSNLLPLEQALQPQAYREFGGSLPSSQACKAAYSCSGAG